MRTQTIKAFILAIASCFAAGAATQAQALQQVDVYTSGVGGYNTYRIPAIVQAKNGAILAFAEGRKNSSSDTGDIDTVLKRSTDGGKTWTALQVVSADSTNTVGNPVPIVDQQTGRIVLLTTRNLGTDSITTIDNGTSTGTRTVWSQYSDDNGATWSTATEITSSVKASNWRWYATGPGHGIQLTQGAHAGRLIVASDHIGPGVSGNQVIYSDDHGVTWHMGASKDGNSSIAFNETTAVELNGGSVLLNARNGSGDHTRSQEISSDSGLSFSSSGVTTLTDPVVEGSINRYSSTLTGQTQNRILFSNPNDPDTRRKMTIRSSFDEAQTWNGGKLVNRNLSGYSDLVTTSAGNSGGLLYENGTTKSYGIISYAAFNTNWLDDSTLAQYDFRTRLPGQTIAASATEIDQRGNGYAATILGSPTTVAGDPRYTSLTKTAVHFDGNNDMIDVPDSGGNLYAFDGNESFSLEVDFRTAAHTTGGANSSGPLISKDIGGSGPSFWLRVENGHARFFLDDGTNTSSLTSVEGVSDGAWHHLVAERDASSDLLKIYIDGMLDSTTPDLTSLSLANSEDLMIGAFNYSSAGVKRFVGDIDYARVADSALTPDQFIQIPEPTGLLSLTSMGLAICCFSRATMTGRRKLA